SADQGADPSDRIFERLASRHAGPIQPPNQARLQDPRDARDHPRHLPGQKAARESDVNSHPARGEGQGGGCPCTRIVSETSGPSPTSLAHPPPPLSPPRKGEGDPTERP